jgi:hypothetical protein
MSNPGVSQRCGHMDQQFVLQSLSIRKIKMTEDIALKRDFVRSLYPGPRWARRVKQMSDSQVVAIYLREHNKAPKPKPPERENDDPPPF